MFEGGHSRAGLDSLTLATNFRCVQVQGAGGETVPLVFKPLLGGRLGREDNDSQNRAFLARRLVF